jgi:hypothetical protein
MNYLTSTELAELTGCKPNQRCRMAAWLIKNKWRFELDASGLPKVARAYHDRKMGISENNQKDKFDETPNLHAFS